MSKFEIMKKENLFFPSQGTHHTANYENNRNGDMLLKETPKRRSKEIKIPLCWGRQ